jgi:hypothetical protein
MAMDDENQPTPNVPSRLAAFDLTTTMDAILGYITDRGWYFTLGVRYLEFDQGTHAASEPMHWASVWIGAHVAPDARTQAQHPNHVEALGGALAAMLELQRPIRKIRTLRPRTD